MQPINSHAPLSSPPTSPKTDAVKHQAPASPTAKLDTFEPNKTEGLEPKQKPLPELSQPGRLRRSWDFLKSSLSGAGALLVQGGRLVANAVMSMGQAAGESITSFVSRFTKKTADKAEAAADKTAKVADDLADKSEAKIKAEANKVA